MHTNKSESQCGSVWQTDGTCGIWESRLDAVQRPGSRETESTRRMTGVWGKRETQKARGRDGAPGSLPCLCLQQKAIVWCDRRPSASNQASLLQDVPWVRCQTQTEDWKTCTPRKALGTLDSHRSLSAAPGTLIAELLTAATKAGLLPSQTFL